MTSPDKPDNVDAPAEPTRDERAVVTAAPAVDAESASGPQAQASGATSKGGATKKDAAEGKGGSGPTGPGAGPTAARNGGTPAGGDTPRPADPRPADPDVADPTVAIPKPVVSPKTTSPEGSDVTSSAPPPWQRVANDNQFVNEHAEKTDSGSKGTTAVGTGSPSEETTRFSDWGYQRSPRSDGYTTSSADAADALSSHYPPVASGTASPSMFAAAAGKSGVQAEARPGNDPSGRTTVNMAAPAAPQAGPRPASTTGVNTPTALRRPGRGPRRASLQVKRVDPWSVLKLAFVLSVALFFVWLVAVGVLYGVLDGMGVWDRVNGTYNEFAQNTSSGSSGPLITASRVFGIAAIIGAINIVLFTALATVGSFVYNVSADLAGGLEITLAERE